MDKQEFQESQEESSFHTQLPSSRQKTRKTPEQYQKEARHWNIIGDNFSELGHFRRAISYYKRSRSLRAKLGPLDAFHEEDWNLLHKVGVAYQLLGETRCAIEYHVDSLKLARLFRDVTRQIDALTQLSTVYDTLGHVHHAVACHIQRVSLYRERRDAENEARALAQLGLDYAALGDVDEAIETCEQSLALARERENPELESIALSALGMSYGSLGYARQTQAYGEQGLLIAREIGDAQAEALACECIGDAHAYLDNMQQSGRAYLSGLTIARTNENRLQEGRLLEKLGLSALSRANVVDKAIPLLMQSQTIFADIGATYHHGRAYAHLGNAYARQGEYAVASEALQEARTLLDEVRMYRGKTLLTYYNALLLHQQRRLEEARPLYIRAMTLFEDVQDRYGWAQCMLDYAQLLRMLGREKEAQSMARSALKIYLERGSAHQIERVQAWLGA